MKKLSYLLRSPQPLPLSVNEEGYGLRRCVLSSYKLFIVACMSLLLFACSKDLTISDSAPGYSAIIYEENGKTPAAGALITIFEKGSKSDSPISLRITNSKGEFNMRNLPEGAYTIFAEKDSFVSMQDSAYVSVNSSTLKNDTLERPSVLSGIVGVGALDEPNTVTLRLLGTGKKIDIVDKQGRFTLCGLAGGKYTLLLTGRSAQYLPTSKELFISPQSITALSDTLRIDYTGIPVVSGIRLVQNIYSGAVRISWNKTAYGELKDYVVFRDPCGTIGLLPEPIRSTQDTFLIDSGFTSLYATLSDTFPQCLNYRVAARSIAQVTGLTNGYTVMQFQPKVFVWTFIAHDVKYRGSLADSVSIDDSIVFVVDAHNRTRPLRKLVFWEPKTGNYQKVLKDTTKKVLRDSLCFAFHDTGNHKIYAVITDSAGNEWWDEAMIRTVVDSLKAIAGNDTGVFVGENIRLHGRAVDLFGNIPFWRWQIGNSQWQRTSEPDTVFIAPLTEQATQCRLWITDEDGTSKMDTMQFFTSLKAVGVSAGGSNSLMLKSDNGLWACGNNMAGQLCNGRISNESIPQRIADDVVAMAAGETFTLILKKGGDLWACGDNAYGQFGDGTTEGRLFPKRIMTNVKSIATGKHISLILKTDSTLWVCGWDQNDGSAGNRYLPWKVMTNVQAIAAGDFHFLMVKTDQTLWSCGENDYGQLGDGTHRRASIPVHVMDSVRTIAAGDKFSLAVKTDGSLWAFGLNDKGQLGDRSGGTNRLTPVFVITDVKSVSAGSAHSLIIKTDNTVWGTGANESGQRGEELLAPKYWFVQITSDAKSIAAGRRHSLILKNDGTVWAFGEDASGQLGNGTQINRFAPARMIPYHYYAK